MPFTTIGGTDGDTQYYHVLFLLGYNKLRVSDIKIATLDLASGKDSDGNYIENGSIPVDSLLFKNRGGIDIELRQDGNNVSFYNQKVVQEDLRLELANVNGTPSTVTRFTAKNPYIVELEFNFPSLIAYDDKNNKSNASCSIKIEWSINAGKTWNTFGQISGCNSYSNGVSTFSRCESKQMRFVARREFNFDEVLSEESIEYGRVMELRVTRTNAQAIDTSKVADKCYLTAIRTWCFDYSKSKNSNTLYPQSPIVERDANRVSLLGLRIKIDNDRNDLQGTLDEVNMILTSYAKVWDRENKKWTDEEYPTNNPASLVRKVMQSNSRGNKVYPDSKIDLEKLGEFYEWCEDNNYFCNGVLTKEEKTLEIINSILNTGRASFSNTGKKYSLVIDKPLRTPVLILNNQNVISASNKKEFNELPSGLRISFINEKDNYQTSEAIVLYNGKTLEDEDLTLTPIELKWITNPEQAIRYGYYELAKMKLRPETWVRKMVTEGDCLEIGHLVEVQDDTISVGIGEGAEVTDLHWVGNYITKIITDGKFEVLDTTQKYGIKITQCDGVNEPVIIIREVTFEEVGVYSELTLKDPIFFDNLHKPNVGDILSFGYYDKITAPAIVVGKKKDENGYYDITLIAYDENIYLADKGDIPEFDSKVTSIIKEEVQLPVQETATKIELTEKINGLITGESVVISNPNAPINVSAIAEQDRIRLSAEPSGTGLSNTVKHYQWQYKKGTSDSWHDLESDNYYFDRDIDGYPEKEDISDWYFRVRIVNTYDKQSPWETTVTNCDLYGTWELPEIDVDTPRQLDRTIVLSMRGIQRSVPITQYGTIKYRIEVSRYDDTEDGLRVWYKPATNKNAYLSELNYRDGYGSVECSETFVQIVPLEGQPINDDPETKGKTKNTLYHYKITPILVVSDKNTPLKIGSSQIVDVIAYCSNIRDIIDADPSAKDEINVRALSAICATLGEVRDGSLSGNENNYWTLSTKQNPRETESNIDYIGAFRVGGTSQYIRVTPKDIQNGIPRDYLVDFKVGNFKVSSTETEVTNILYLYDENDFTTHGKEGIEPYHTKRLFLSYQGIVIQKNSDDATSDTNGVWSDIGRITVDENSNLYITNTNINDDNFPKIKTFVDGSVYHFDTNLLNDDQEEEDNTLVTGSLISDSSTPINENSLNVLQGKINRVIEPNEEFFCFIKNARISIGGDIIPESGYTLSDYKKNLHISSNLFVYKE